MHICNIHPNDTVDFFPDFFKKKNQRKKKVHGAEKNDIYGGLETKTVPRNALKNSHYEAFFP